jgi:D-serine deaminase-like pyridoxal phosphate-dependent protein
VLVDIDVGQHRTGVPPGEEAVRLYELVSRQRSLRPGGLHVYDGHNHQESLQERKEAVAQLLGPVRELLQNLQHKGLPVPRVVAGGTPTFSVWAALDLPGLECSPGTCVLHDHGYGSHYPDLAMTAGALMLTRVVSRPPAERVTFDLGTKAVASDPPAGRRCIILDLSDAKMVGHNEEHLIVETPQAGRYEIGDVAYAMPTHICPTCALHKQALVVEKGEVVDRWEIVGRDRMLTV